jgi:hypothetical protein
LLIVGSFFLFLLFMDKIIPIHDIPHYFLASVRLARSGDAAVPISACRGMAPTQPLKGFYRAAGVRNTR